MAIKYECDRCKKITSEEEDMFEIELTSKCMKNKHKGFYASHRRDKKMWCSECSDKFGLTKENVREQTPQQGLEEIIREIISEEISYHQE